jgi:hypothetical protein
VLSEVSTGSFARLSAGVAELGSVAAREGVAAAGGTIGSCCAGFADGVLGGSAGALTLCGF